MFLVTHRLKIRVEEAIDALAIPHVATQLQPIIAVTNVVAHTAVVEVEAVRVVVHDGATVGTPAEVGWILRGTGGEELGHRCVEEELV